VTQSEIPYRKQVYPKDVQRGLDDLEFLTKTEKKSLSKLFLKCHLFINSKEKIHAQYLMSIFEKTCKTKVDRERLTAQVSGYIDKIVGV